MIHPLGTALKTESVSRTSGTEAGARPMGIPVSVLEASTPAATLMSGHVLMRVCWVKAEGITLESYPPQDAALVQQLAEERRSLYQKSRECLCLARAGNPTLDPSSHTTPGRDGEEVTSTWRLPSLSPSHLGLLVGCGQDAFSFKDVYCGIHWHFCFVRYYFTMCPVVESS